MKNIQVIDGADNCTYDVFSISNDDFELFFPKDQDVEFIEDAIERIGEENASQILQKLWNNRADKKKISGIHGTLFYELSFKKKFYPTKKEREMVVVL